MPSSNMIWISNYKILKEYYEENGTIDTLNTYKISANLHNWVASQRRAYRLSSRTDLNKRHIYLLNQIQFDWSPTRTILLNSNMNREREIIASKEDNKDE